MFVNELGNPSHPDTPRKNIQKIGRKAGLPTIAPHDLRHTAASLAIENNQPLTDVASGLGHQNPKTTLSIYAHAVRERDQARKLDTNIDKYINDID